MASTSFFGQLFSTGVRYVNSLVDGLSQIPSIPDPPGTVNSSTVARSTAASLTIPEPPNKADPSTEESFSYASSIMTCSPDSYSTVEFSNEVDPFIEDSSAMAGSMLADSSTIRTSDEGSSTTEYSSVKQNFFVKDSLVADSLDSRANLDASAIALSGMHTENKGASGKKVHICDGCDELPGKRCSGCSKAWYCSTSCQRGCWYRHIFECNPRRPIDTADYLYLAVVEDSFPRDKQTCEDYGFARASTSNNRSELLGLYMGLIKYLKIKPQTLHKWRIDGVLSQEIIATFNRLPGDNRGEYFPWFLQNRYVLDRTLPVPDHESDMMRCAWQFIGGPSSDSDADIKAIMRIMPEHKVKCFMFYKTLLANWYPSVDQEFYVEFGFCACDDIGETSLGHHYKDLINVCTFDEFCDAYNSSSILSLLDLDIRHRMTWPDMYPDLEDVLQGSPHAFKSVWYLKQMVKAEVPKEDPSVMVDYGFVNCRNEGEKEALMEVYRKVLCSRSAKPLELHEAAIQGKLFDYVGGLVKLKKKFKRLMKNPYPLASF